MAYYSQNQFTTFQGRADRFSASPRASRLPLVTLGLGMISALAIVAGALDWVPVNVSGAPELLEIEFLTGVIDEDMRINPAR